MMGKVLVEFDYNNRANFDISDVTDEQVFTALLGLESWIAAKSEIPVSEIRSIMDEMKLDLEVKPIV